MSRILACACTIAATCCLSNSVFADDSLSDALAIDLLTDVNEQEKVCVIKGGLARATPAVANDAMFVRSDKFSWKIASSN